MKATALGSSVIGVVPAGALCPGGVIHGTVTPDSQYGATFGSFTANSFGSAGWGIHGCGDPLLHVGSRIPTCCRALGTDMRTVPPWTIRRHSSEKKKKSLVLSVL